jgi:hypothetical protein
MNVLVDTPVWSEFFRRSSPNSLIRDAMRRIIFNGEAILIGPIRQEILSGIKDFKQYELLRNTLRAFPDEPIGTEDYEQAAAISNQCRGKGIQGSNTDFLICSLAHRLSVPIFTLDQDFAAFASLIPIRLYNPAEGTP